VRCEWDEDEQRDESRDQRENTAFQSELHRGGKTENDEAPDAREVYVDGRFQKFGAMFAVFLFQADDGIRGRNVTGVQTCALPIYLAIFNRHKAGAEPIGDVQIQYTELGAVEVNANEVPLLVDELPLVALLASHARGRSLVRRSEERRVGKEGGARGARWPVP